MVPRSVPLEKLGPSFSRMTDRGRCPRRTFSSLRSAWDRGLPHGWRTSPDRSDARFARVFGRRVVPEPGDLGRCRDWNVLSYRTSSSGVRSCRALPHAPGAPDAGGRSELLSCRREEKHESTEATPQDGNCSESFHFSLARAKTTGVWGTIRRPSSRFLVANIPARNFDGQSRTRRSHQEISQAAV
jgi:hypothetical protein